MNEYRTFDLGLAAFLRASGIVMSRLEKIDPKKSEFVFEECAGAYMSLANAYFNGTATIPALAYFNAIKNLKNQIYST